MDLRRYSHVVALADTGNFHRAAARVHLSQPAFSRSIQAAEAELGMTLFERSGDGIRCTPAGEFVVARLRPLVKGADNLARALAQFRDGEMSELSLGMGPFVAATLLPPLLTQLRASHPQVNVRVLVRNPQFLIEPLKKEDLDFYVADARFSAADPELDTAVLGRLGGGLFVRRGHPLVQRVPLRMRDLVPFGLATGRLPPEVQQHFKQAMGIADGDPLPVAVDCDDITALKAVGLASDFVMIVTPVLLQQEQAAGAVVQLLPTDLQTSHSELGLVRLRGRTPPPVAALAADLIMTLARSGQLGRV